MIAWPLIKTFAPWLLIITAFGATYFAGYYNADQERIEQIAAIRANSDAVLRSSLERSAVIRKNLTTATQHIEATANANRSIIDTLYADNLARAKRLQFTAGCRRDATDSDTGAAGMDDERNDTGTRILQQVGQRIVEDARIAGRAAEIARNWKDYALTIREACK